MNKPLNRMANTNFLNLLRDFVIWYSVSFLVDYLGKTNLVIFIFAGFITTCVMLSKKNHEIGYIYTTILSIIVFCQITYKPWLELFGMYDGTIAERIGYFVGFYIAKTLLTDLCTKNKFELKDCVYYLSAIISLICVFFIAKDMQSYVDCLVNIIQSQINVFVLQDLLSDTVIFIPVAITIGFLCFFLENRQCEDIKIMIIESTKKSIKKYKDYILGMPYRNYIKARDGFKVYQSNAI